MQMVAVDASPVMLRAFRDLLERENLGNLLNNRVILRGGSTCLDRRKPVDEYFAAHRIYLVLRPSDYLGRILLKT